MAVSVGKVSTPITGWGQRFHEQQNQWLCRRVTLCHSGDKGTGEQTHRSCLNPSREHHTIFSSSQALRTLNSENSVPLGPCDQGTEASVFLSVFSPWEAGWRWFSLVIIALGSAQSAMWRNPLLCKTQAPVPQSSLQNSYTRKWVGIWGALRPHCNSL